MEDKMSFFRRLKSFIDQATNRVCNFINGPNARQLKFICEPPSADRRHEIYTSSLRLPPGCGTVKAHKRLIKAGLAFEDDSPLIVAWRQLQRSRDSKK